MNKRKIYESIMREVSKRVKITLNENVPFYNQLPNGDKELCYVCTEEEKERILNLIDEHSIGEDLKYDGIDSKEIFEENFSLGEMTGILGGEINYWVSINSYEDWDGDYADGRHHSWTEYEVEDYGIDTYNLIFTDDESGDEIVVYLEFKDAQ